ncbi:hypothetical protein BH24CHL3_BH24CHL3_05060 [soil metagenome]
MTCADEDAGRSNTVAMNAILRFFNFGGKRIKSTSTRFDRYYISVLETGAGYPTADEARKDLNNYDNSFSAYGWPR